MGDSSFSLEELESCLDMFETFDQVLSLLDLQMLEE
jgi:hypothetical protein